MTGADFLKPMLQRLGLAIVAILDDFKMVQDAQVHSAIKIKEFLDELIEEMEQNNKE